MLIGKTDWKSVALPSILNATAEITWKKKEIETLQRTENSVWRKILGAPSHAPIVTLQGEVGTSSILTRDIKAKLSYVQHIMRGNIRGNDERGETRPMDKTS